jgi:hypothetical protein
MHAVKLNVHPATCDCDRQPDCRGKFVVNMPGTDLTPRSFMSYEQAEEQMRRYALGGVPVGEPGVHGPVHPPA